MAFWRRQLLAYGMRMNYVLTIPKLELFINILGCKYHTPSVGRFLGGIERRDEMTRMACSTKRRIIDRMTNDRCERIHTETESLNFVGSLLLLVHQIVIVTNRRGYCCDC